MATNPPGYWREWYHRPGNKERRTKYHRKARRRLRQHYFKLANYTCHYCHEQFVEKKLSLDHKDPVLLESGAGRRYRLNDPNLIVACGTCNRRKGTKTYQQFLDQLAAEAYERGGALPDDVAGGHEPDLEPAL